MHSYNARQAAQGTTFSSKSPAIPARPHNHEKTAQRGQQTGMAPILIASSSRVPAFSVKPYLCDVGHRKIATVQRGAAVAANARFTAASFSGGNTLVRNTFFLHTYMARSIVH